MIYSFSTSERIRLDEFLRRELPLKLNEPQNSSNSKIRRLIVAGAVFVNSRQVRRPAFELRGHSNVSVDFDEEKFLYEKQPDDIKFQLTEKDVLYEDEYLICVNKHSFYYEDGKGWTTFDETEKKWVSCDEPSVVTEHKIKNKMKSKFNFTN